VIYVLHGPDEFSMRETAARLLADALPPETASLNTTRLATGQVTLEALRLACEAMPFLAERRVVIIEGFFSSLASRRRRAAPTGGAEPHDAPAAETSDGAAPADDAAQAIASYLPRIPPTALVIFLDSVPPPRTGPLARALEQARARQQHFPLLAGAALQRWIKARARQEGATITERAADLLATYAGTDLRALASEIKKLATYAGPARAIDEAAVQALVSQAREANVFELVDAFARGDRRQALAALLTLLEQGERPERILGMVARQVRLLLQARDALDHGETVAGLSRLLALPPYPTRLLAEQARLFRTDQLEAMHRRVLDTDIGIKTGRLPAELALELLAAELAGEARRPAPGAPSSRGRRSS
jgi:DNA polymerase-3 subunit delta